MEDPAQNAARRQIGGLLKQMIDEAKTASQEWRSIGDSLMRYGFAKDYDFEYAKMLPQSRFKAKYAKTAEAFQQLGSRMAPLSDITRLLRPRSMDPAVIARTEARMAYLNYTPPINRYIHQRRQVVNDGIGYGTGVMWTGRDERTGLITSMWDPIGRTLRDAQARMPEDVRCVFRKRVRPRQEVIKAYPEAAEQIEKISDYSPEDTDRNEWLQSSTPPSKGVICYWECWFNRGLQAYQGGTEAVSSAMQDAGKGALSKEQQRNLIITGKDDPVVYLITEDGHLFHNFSWPIPFHLMVRDGWPCTFFDLYTGTDPLHPVSPIAPGLGIQRALNQMMTQIMERASFELQGAYVMKTQNGKGLGADNTMRVLKGTGMTYLSVDLGIAPASDGKIGLKDFVESLNFPMTWLGAAQSYMDWMEKLYERLTPLSEFLATGAGETQDRSAAATKARDRNQMTRIEDMKDMIRDADTMTARKEAFAASYLLNEKDIAKLLPEEAPKWGFLAEEEAKDPQYWLRQLPPVVAQDPMQGVPFAMQMAAQSYTLDEVIYQTDFEIEASSTRRKDVDQQLEVLDREANTVWPLQLQSQDPFQMAAAYDGMALQAKLSGMDASVVEGRKQIAERFRQLALNPPPPPMPAEAPPAEGAPV